MSKTISIDGLKEVTDMLRAVGPKQGRRIVQKGLRAGAKEVRTVERTEAPKLTGRTRRSITVKRGRAPKGKIRVSALPRAKAFEGMPFYPAFVIQGHRIGKSEKRVPPNDFVTRAFEQAGEKAAETATQTILDEIDKLTN